MNVCRMLAPVPLFNYIHLITLHVTYGLLRSIYRFIQFLAVFLLLCWYSRIWVTTKRDGKIFAHSIEATRQRAQNGKQSHRATHTLENMVLCPLSTYDGKGLFELSHKNV